MEMPAEEILARLERYVAAQRSPAFAVDTLVPSRPIPRAVQAMPRAVQAMPRAVQAMPRAVQAMPRAVQDPTRTAAPGSRLFAETMAVALFTASCVLALFASARLKGEDGVFAVVALALVAVAGLVWRVRFAGAWATGLVVAALLVRFS